MILDVTEIQACALPVWQQKSVCEDSKNEQQLFSFDEKEKRWRTKILFSFEDQKMVTFSQTNHYEYSRDKDGFFRVTLQSLSLSFSLSHLLSDTHMHVCFFCCRNKTSYLQKGNW